MENGVNLVPGGIATDWHKTVPVQVWVDVDIAVAGLVLYLNTIPGVRTIASCEGTIGQGGEHPYRAYVLAQWGEEAWPRLSAEFDIQVEGNNWGYVYPKTFDVVHKASVK